DALAALSTIAGSGSLTIQNGRNLIPPGAFTNAGELVIGAGSTFGNPTPPPPPPPPPAPNGLRSYPTGEGNPSDRADGNDGNTPDGISYAPGISGQTFNFSGSTYVSVPSAPNINFSSSFTISTWVNLSANNFNNGLVYKGDLSGNQGVYSLGFFTGGSN